MTTSDPKNLKLALISASYCTPCKRHKPLLTKLAADAGIPLEILDAEDDSKAVGALGVMTVPTTLLMDGTTELSRLEGAYPQKKLQEWLESLGGTK